MARSNPLPKEGKGKVSPLLRHHAIKALGSRRLGRLGLLGLPLLRSLGVPLLRRRGDARSGIDPSGSGTTTHLLGHVDDRIF